MSPFTRSQTQIMYGYLPGALFEHDRYSICMVTDIVCDPADDINASALFEAIYDVLRSWPDSVPHRYPDPRREQDQYSVGVPREIRFMPYPTVLECQRCGHIETLERLQRLSGLPPRCTRPGCDGSFRQLPYVQIHNCGRIEALYVRSCSRHGRADLTFMDTGRVATSAWRCRTCGNAAIGRLRMTPCGCEWSQKATKWHQRAMRVVRTNDSSVFYSQTQTFVNLKEDKLRLLRNDRFATGLLLARIWSLLSDSTITVAEQRKRIESEGPRNDRVDPLIQQMIDQLGPENPAVREYLAAQAQREHMPGQEEIDQVAEKLHQEIVEAPPSRRLVEHVAVLDTLKSWTIDDVINMAKERGDAIGSLSLVEARNLAESLGFTDIRCLFDFPMALCAVGYTRGANDPERATLRPFQVASTEGRTPVYVLAAETEGVMFQLDPVRVATWLHSNGVVSETSPSNTVDGWAWIRRNVPALSAERWQDTWNERAAKITRTLLHTISHLLLRHIEWSGFDPESVGEYLLPETLSVILYTNRYTGFTIGGLVTLFEQRLLNWLETAHTEGATCLYDPFCTDEGGSCVGCLHRRYNCQLFNEDLSRIVLYGGITADGWEIQRGYWPL